MKVGKYLVSKNGVSNCQVSEEEEPTWAPLPILM